MIPKSWDKLAERIKLRMENEKKVKERGGNKFQQLEARLKDEKSGKLVGDIVLYGIKVIEDFEDAKSFFRGYVLNIKKNFDKYPPIAKKNPLNYAKADIYLALGHFYSEKTHNLWNKILSN